jgi:hypothetical protein
VDDQDDRGYSRAPELEDLLTLCQALNAEGVRYVLIGGFAVILHGFVRATKDIDLLIDASVENVQRLKRAMAVLPDNAIALIADDEVERYQVVRIADEIVGTCSRTLVASTTPARPLEESRSRRSRACRSLSVARSC